MRNLFIIICFIFFISCAKEYDPVKEIVFTDPVPANGAKDVQLWFKLVRFKSIIGLSSYNFNNVKTIYFDTLNPPIQTIYINNYNLKYDEGFRPIASYYKYEYTHNLTPKTNYYWAYTVENMGGEIKSEINTFTTVGFDGNWRILDSEIEYHSSKLEINKDVIEFQISGSTAKLWLYNPSDTVIVNTTFEYLKNHYISFYDHENYRGYYFEVKNVGYIGNRVVLIITNTKKYSYTYYRY